MQISFDSISKERFVIDKPIRLIELFAGIGAFSKALTRLNVPFEHHLTVDNCRYKIKGFNAIHDTELEPADIKTLKGSDLRITDTDNYVYMLTYSYPCKSISMAGKREGMSKGSGTESSLLWEVERLLIETKELPQLLIMENVKQVRDNLNRDDFVKWVGFLEYKGYSNYVKILDAKDYDVPQSRERCFMVSILGDYYYEFPQTVELKERLRDRMESDVDESYYLNDKQIAKLLKDIKQSKHGYTPTLLNENDYSNTIDTRIGAFSHTSQYLCIPNGGGYISNGTQGRERKP